jgi:hypothetical protein
MIGDRINNNHVYRRSEMVAQKRSKKKTGKKKEPKKLYTALVPLEDFLNGHIHWMIEGSVNSTEDIEALRTELIDDLSPITNLPEGGSARFRRSEKIAAAKRMEAHLEHLCEKITNMDGLRPVFVVESSRLIPNRRLQSKAQGVFSWSVGEWVIRLRFGVDHSALRRELYAFVADGLVAGELARLRRCGYCQRFFIAPQARMAFCPGHARLYYDRPSQRPEQQKARIKIRINSTGRCR